MHELNIVSYVIKQVEQVAKDNDVDKIASVTLEFGEVSGIIPAQLEDCWNWYAKKTPSIEGAKFKYDIIPAVTICNACGKTYPTLKYAKICPECKSEDTVLLQGNEMNIKEIEVYTKE